MIARITKLLILCFLVGLAIYFVSINSNPVSVSLSDHNTIAASAGVIILFSFALGLILATLAGGFFALKGYFRELGYRRREQLRTAQDEAIAQSRSLSAGGELKRAKLSLEKLINKDRTSVLLRLELVSVLKKMGEPQKALTILNEARQSFPENAELIYETAELHEQLGNFTASIDALALALSKSPTAYAATRARDLSMKLDRFEDALLYNEKIRELDGNSPEIKETAGNIQAHILIRDLALKPEELMPALIEHLKTHERCILALTELSKLKLAEGRADEAAQCLQRAFRTGRHPAHIREARNIWFANGYKDKAISAIKTWSREAVGEELLQARLELAKTYLLIGQDTDAAYEVDLLEREPYAQTFEAKRDLAIMKAIIAYRSRDSLRSIEAFREVESLELAPSTKLPTLFHER